MKRPKTPASSWTPRSARMRWGVVYGGETDGALYFACISDELVARVEAEGGDVAFVRTANNVLVTEAEFEQLD